MATAGDDAPSVEAVRRAWDANAAFWDEAMGEGNTFHLRLVRPATEALLAARAGERILDVGCGNGLFARRLAGMGARVTACDASVAMLARARAYGDGDGRIAYAHVDATDGGALAALGEGTFDAAVANMVLMDIPDIAPLAHALPGLLRPGGRFVFSVAHPCFHSTATERVVEERERDGVFERIGAVRVRRYASLAPGRGVAIAGQPALQWYFDRPLAALFEPFLAAGLAVTGLREPTWPEDLATDALGAVWGEMPPVLVVRLARRD